jgi:hypothetical protein
MSPAEEQLANGCPALFAIGFTADETNALRKLRIMVAASDIVTEDCPTAWTEVIIFINICSTFFAGII